MKKNESKKFSLSATEMSELSYLVQNAEASREVMVYWQKRVQGKQQAIEGNKAIDREKYTVDWTDVFATGTIMCVPKPTVVTDPVPKEEKK